MGLVKTRRLAAMHPSSPKLPPSPRLRRIKGRDEAADERRVPFHSGESWEGRYADKMKVAILSFSYKRGLPEDKTGNGGGFVFDCRAMPNPFWEESLRGYSGRDKPVVDFFARFPGEVKRFLDATECLARQSIWEYIRDGREHLQIAFGCTGGQHRSVYFAGRMAERLRGIDGVEVEVAHAAIWYNARQEETWDL